VATHTLDYDDTALSATDGHPSAPMVAPLLCLGAREGATGADLLTGYVAGYETQAYLNGALTPGHYEGGWHATATMGTFGAAAATASLLDLPAEQTEHALNIAASMPAGLKRNFGSMTKPVHVGQAARSGVTAARLAAEGVDADADAIGGDRGFYDLYRGEGAPDPAASHDLGEEWVVVTDGVDVKKYACCYYTHASIYGTAQLAETHDIEPGDVERVRAVASQGARDACVHDDPGTPFQAKFSMPHLVAYALVHGTVDLAAFEDEGLADEAVRAVRERVDFAVDDGRPYDWYGGDITIETVDNRQIQATRDCPPGTHDNPLTEAQLREKFEMCARRVLPDDDVEATYERLNTLRAVDDVTEITRPL